MLRQRVAVAAADDARQRDGDDARIARLDRRDDRVVRDDGEVIGAVAAEGVGADAAAHGVAVVAAGRHTAASAAAALRIIFIRVVGVHVAGNAAHLHEAVLPDGEGFRVAGTVHAVMGDPVVIFVEAGARERAVEEGRRAVDGRRVARRFDGAAEGLDNIGEKVWIHAAVRSRLDVVEDRKVERAAVQNVEAELRLLLRHLYRGGVAEVVHADGNVVRHAAGIVLREAGIHLRDPVLAAVARTDDGEVDVAVFRHRRPVDIPLVIRDVDALERDVYLAGRVGAVRQMRGDGGDAVADALDDAAADSRHARVARAPGLDGDGPEGGCRVEGCRLAGTDGDHRLVQREFRRREGGRGEGGSYHKDENQKEREQFLWHDWIHPPFVGIAHNGTALRASPSPGQKSPLNRHSSYKNDYMGLT